LKEVVAPLKEGEEKPITINTLGQFAPPKKKKTFIYNLKTTMTMGWMLA
jgi:hypothetical protein